MRTVLALLAALSVAAPASAQRRPRGAPVDTSPRVYVVRPGDNIRRIATFLQVPFRELAARTREFLEVKVDDPLSRFCLAPQF